MRTELIQIPTDTIPVDGAYYNPEDGPIRGAVLLMHGNTMNFYTGPPRFLPPSLTALGYACLAFNRRGHDILTTRTSRAPEGGAFQTVAQGLADTEYAARFLAERGFPAPIAIGHSTGGVLAAEYAAQHPGTPAMVLLSAHWGGPRIAEGDRRAGMLAGAQLEEISDQAQQLVASGQGRQLMLVPGWWYVISAESFLDRMEHMPNMLDAAPRIQCPSLFIRGSQEPPPVYPAEEFQRLTGAPCEVAIVENADHFYNGAEEAVATAVSDWLRSTLG